MGAHPGFAPASPGFASARECFDVYWAEICWSGFAPASPGFAWPCYGQATTCMLERSSQTQPRECFDVYRAEILLARHRHHCRQGTWSLQLPEHV